MAVSVSKLLHIWFSTGMPVSS